MIGLARNWWLMALRGLAALVFGLLTVFYPAASLIVLLLFFGAYVLVDGIFAVIAGSTAPAGTRRWRWLIAGGILGIFVGIAALLLPFAAAIAITIWIAVWAIFIGITQIVSAIRLRKEIEGEFWLILGGILALIFGIYAIISPLAGAFAIAFGVGIFAIIYGIFMLMAAFRLRGMHIHHTNTV